MNRQEMILKYAQNDEERLLGRRLLDLYDKVERSGQKMYTGFLSNSEQAFCTLICSSIKIPISFWGGYDGAERSIGVIFFDEVEELMDFKKQEIVAAIMVTYQEELSHRDLLGAAMGLGIKRQMIGDILVGEKESTLLVAKNMVNFFLNNYDKAGHVTLKCKEISLDSIKFYELNFEMKTDTIASNRLDSVVASGFSLSRELVKKAIMRELVNVNYRVATSSDMEVKEGDVISMRGQGKFILSSIGGKSRKGRIWIEIKKYV